MADADPKAAQSYYDTNKAEIAGTAQVQIERSLRLGGIKVRSQEAADAVMAKGLSETEAFAYVRKHHEGEDEDAILTRVKAQYAEREEATMKYRVAAANSAWRLYADTGDINAVPSHILAAMDGKDFATLRAQAKRDAAGIKTETDWGVYGDLRFMAANAPETFLGTDLRELYPALAPAEREKLHDLQDTIRKGETPKASADDVTLMQQMTAIYRELGWDDAPKDKAKKGALFKAVEDAIYAEQRRLGEDKKITDEQRRKIIDRLIVSGEIEGAHWWSFDKPARAFEVSPDDASRFRVEVPEFERKKIEAALRRAGHRVDDAAVEALYKRALEAGTVRQPVAPDED